MLFVKSAILDINPTLSKTKLHVYAGSYVALNLKNEVVGSGKTYAEATKNIKKGSTNIAVFSIPKSDVILVG
jgi:hypothetical protein